MERGRRSTAGGTASTAVRVELATQLGLPSTATFDEVKGNVGVPRRIVNAYIKSIGTAVSKKQNTYDFAYIVFIVDRRLLSSRRHPPAVARKGY